jgi:hypothetical protein
MSKNEIAKILIDAMYPIQIGLALFISFRGLSDKEMAFS